MRFPPFDDTLKVIVLETDDPVRYATILLAIKAIVRRGVAGAFAELGVYRGDASRAIHAAAPERLLFLFDTFEGFPLQDAAGSDARFRDTSIETVKTKLGDTNNVVFRPGYFPETAAGLEGERFAFVLLDADLYKPTLAGLRFFYPRVSPGGYIFLHDYNSAESDWAVSRAAREFLADKPETLLEIPDKWGTAILAKV